MKFARPYRSVLVELFTFTFLVSGPAFAAGPNITNISPGVGAAGASITVTGTSFGGTQGSSTITFNGVAGIPVSWANTKIVVPVPVGATSGAVIVTVSGVPSGGVSFTVVPAPNIANLSPTAAPIGTSVTVTGSGFGATEGTSTIKFGTKAGTPLSWSDSSIVVPVPTGASTGNVVVNANGVSSNGVVFTVLSVPSVASLTPASGAIGAAVAVAGSNFGTTQGTSTITFNGTTATPTSWANAKIVVSVPAGATSGNVIVTVSGVVSAGVPFTVAPAPNIASLSPTGAPVGTSVVISGSGFGPTQGNGTVKFNTKVASPTSWSDSTIVVPVPTGATTGNVVVNASGVTSNGVSFSVLPVPSINNLSPMSAAIGASVTVTGANFGATQSSSTITFNGVVGLPTSWANGKIVVPVPAGATSGNIAVTALGVESPGVNFTVAPPPNVSGISPGTGPAGALTTIAGSGFGAEQGTSTVKFNGKVAASMSWSDSSITVPVPANASSGNVIVHASGVDSNGVAFTVLPTPSITSLSPTSGTLGTSVTITGTNFGSPQGTSTVTFNGVSSSPTSWAKTKIVVPVPLGATTGSVVITVQGVPSVGVIMSLPPVINTVSPASGGVGTSVTITGANFGVSQGAGIVTFNGIAGTPTSWAPGAITIPVPTGTTTGGVVVTVAGIASNAQNFTVNTPVPSSIIVTPANQSIPTGATLQFIATETYTDGSTQDVSSTATWSSSATNVATVTSNGLTSTLVTGQTTIQAAVGPINGSTQLTVSDFTLTGSMAAARRSHSATVLNNGLVLMAGGFGTNGANLSAELFNAATGTFSGTGSMNSAHALHSATLLDNGQVLIVGGYDVNENVQNTAEIFDPSTGTFTLTGNLNFARASHTATLLGDGTVLIAGGVDSNANPLASAEVFDPSTGLFTSVGSLNTGRVYHTATPLNNGAVLIAGGQDANFDILSSAELYNPSSETFTPAGNLGVGRRYHTATLLNGGKVLFAGGGDGNFSPISVVELYDPLGAAFSTTGSLNTARGQHTATLLNNGTVLVAGGIDFNGSTFTSAEIYDPVAGTFSSPASLKIGRFVHTASLLTNGLVLVAGGNDSDFLAEASAELFQPGTLSPAGLTSIAVSPSGPSVAVGIAQAFIATGTFSNGSAEQLYSVTWGSSNPGMASITNDVTNRGDAFVAAAGSTTISACTGSVCSSTNASLAPATLTITSLLPSIGAPGTVVSVAGTSFGATQGGSTVTFNGTPATVISWSNAGIVVSVPPGTTTGNVFVTVTGVQSDGVLFTVLAPPNITSISPTSGTFGTAVTVTGTGFGTTNGQGVSFNGLAAPITSWSDTTITVTVPFGATTGNVVVINAAGVASGGVPFTVIVPPSISAFASPAPNNAGWNNSNVTVSFTCTAGSAPVTSCPAPQIVSSEGVNQIVSGTTTDANGLMATATVSFNIDKTPPNLAVTAPTDGIAFSTTPAPVTGTLSDALSGISSVTCDQIPASFVAGTFSCNISLNVGVNLVVVRATDIAGNVAGSNFHLSLTGTLPAPNSIQITPGAVNMLVGDTQQFTAVDDQYQPRLDATWTVSNPALASITSDASPVLTAIAIGQVTLIANVGALSVQVQVNIVGGTALPTGTVRWSVPPLSQGGATISVLQAAPVLGAPDLFSVEQTIASDGSVGNAGRAFTADGRAVGVPFNIISGNASYFGVGIADSEGGLLATIKSALGCAPGQASISDHDGQTGSLIWNVFVDYDCTNPSPAVGPNGQIYLTIANHSSLIGLDGTTGSQVARYDMPLTPGVNGDQNVYGGLISNPVIDSNGTVFALAVKFFSNVSEQLWLVAMQSDGSTNVTQIPVSVTLADVLSAKLIPDGSGSVYAAWQDDTSNSMHMFHNGSDTTVNLSAPPDEMVLDENGVVYASVNSSNQGTITALAGGTNALWTYQTSASSSDTAHIIGASGGPGGAVIIDQVQGLISLNAAGSPGTPSGFATPASFSPSLLIPLDMANFVGSVAGAMSKFVQSTLPNGFASSNSPFSNGNLQKQHQPPLCQRLLCGLAAHSDISEPNEFVPGVMKRVVLYEVFSKQKGQLTLLSNGGSILKSKIAVYESNATNPATAVCDWTAPDRICETPNEQQTAGFYTDIYTAGNTGANTVTQTFFIDMGQVQVFWPDSTLSTWYGAWTQDATVDPNNPNGAKIVQNSPDLQHGYSCSPAACSTRLP
jgi:hypothetical protein